MKQLLLNLWNRLMGIHLIEPNQYRRHHDVKLNRAKVREIKYSYFLLNETQDVLAGRYGVGQSTISDVVTGRTWKGV